MRKYINLIKFIIIIIFISWFFQLAPRIIIEVFLKLKEKNLSYINENITSYISPISSIFLIIFFVIYYKEKFFKIIYFKKISLKNIFIILFLALSSSIFMESIAYNPFIKKYFLDYQLAIINSLNNSSNLSLMIINVVIISQLFEEILFRGVIFYELQKNINFKLAILIQAALYGMYHLDLLLLPVMFIVGILLGIVYKYTNSIWSSIILHGFFNLTSFLSGYFISESLYENYWYVLAIISLNILLISLYNFKKLNKDSTQN